MFLSDNSLFVDVSNENIIQSAGSGLTYWTPNNTIGGGLSEGQTITQTIDYSSKCKYVMKVFAHQTSDLPGSFKYSINGAKVTYSVGNCYSGVLSGGNYYPCYHNITWKIDCIIGMT